ncbi:MAG TPA: hypothetical protein VFT90_07095, partial [Chryseosolibacter sp.]|nr:hypothetical protein [Chryseosolibacter sp.]
MLIQETPLKHWIEKFYGYGSWHAKMWFIALEEGGGDTPEEVAEKIDYFYVTHASNTQPTLCDIREMYRHVSVNWDGPKANLFSNFFEFRFGDKAVPHSVWTNLIAFG